MRDTTRWLRRLAAAVAVAAITVTWVNTRVARIEAYQNPAHPAIYDTYPVYHSMAIGLEQGRLGQVDLAITQQPSLLHDASASYQHLLSGAPHHWVNYYALDIGYSFIVEAARLAFPVLPDNHLRSLALQLVVDAAVIVFVFFLFSHWNLWLGFIGAWMYAANIVSSQLVSLAFYYYWDIPLAFVVIGALGLALSRPAEATGWLTLAAAALGFGVWLRGTWWPLSLLLFTIACSSPVLRTRLVIPIAIFTILAMPQVIRSSYARGRLTLSTRAAWHVAVVGLGYSPNPYGFQLKDDSVFTLTRDKYGVEFNMVDYDVHEQAAKKEFLSIWQKDPGFVVRSFLRRLSDSIVGVDESQSFSFFRNGQYRVLCLTGFLLMILRGGDKRTLALAAGGSYSTYVLLTCAFYYVGLAYDSVTQVTLLILFIGGVEAVIHGARQLLDCDSEWRTAAG